MSINSPEFMEQAAMIQFVKIIERFPDIYDHNLETYRRWSADKAWEKVVETVKAEMNMDCTLEELKSKWKGIRSSYNRSRNKLNEDKRKGITSSKKYYLYDALQFLEPFTKSKGFIKRSNEVTQNVFQDYDNEEDNEQENASVSDSKWGVIQIKPELSENVDETDETNCYSDTDDQKTHKKSKKRKHESTSETNEDLHFFRSILPDIASFTSKEKRKLKIGILKLVDDIENQRRTRKRNIRSDCSSSS